ncbi:FAD-binding protein [Entomohabitans teleogrylli]|uniref:FAD-binding protein n=1 Tax=Entomohabitans teleogrylli TaxID=1384589 RepID=UPI00073D1BF4|nr:FAD-binding protein [Entomohabitans teleogrylli]
MNIALVLLQPADIDTLLAFVEDNDLTTATLSYWRVDGEYVLAEQLLAPLESAFHQAPVEMLLFAGSHGGDELATRLAWRLQGCALCQASAYSAAEGTVSKAVYGNGLVATFQPQGAPLCLSLAGGGPRRAARIALTGAERTLTPQPLRATLSAPQSAAFSRHPLETAQRVLACGHGTVGVDTARLAAALGAQEGYSRQRIMAGGCDAQRMLGISGQKVAPSLCIVAGASGASAFMAGIAGSDFIVAINRDPDAPVFTMADVGIVGDAGEALETLAACCLQALSC